MHSGAVSAGWNPAGGTQLDQPEPLLTSGFPVLPHPIMCSHAPPNASPCRGSRNICEMGLRPSAQVTARKEMPPDLRRGHLVSHELASWAGSSARARPDWTG